PTTGTNTITAALLTLNGPGLGNNGPLLNVSGNNVWSGNVVLDSAPSAAGIILSANAASSLTISGTISDLGSVQNVTKEGAGTIVFSHDNTYRGQTNINNGILTIEAPLAL